MAEMVEHYRHRKAGEFRHGFVQCRDIGQNLEMPTLVCGAVRQPRQAIDVDIAAEQHIDPAPHRALFAAGGQKVGRGVVIDNDNGLHRRVAGAALQRGSVVRSVNAWLNNDRPADPQCPVKMAKGGLRCRRRAVASLGDLWRRAVKDMEMAIAGPVRNGEAGRLRVRVRRGAERGCGGHARSSGASASQLRMSSVSAP